MGEPPQSFISFHDSSWYYPETVANGAEHPSPTASVSLGRGNGTFQTAEFYDYGATGGRNIVTADFNGDGIPDVAYSFVGTNVGTENEDVVLLLGTANGGFAAPKFVTAGSCTGNLTEWIATGDVNGDGKADLVATLTDNAGAGCQTHTVAVMAGSGKGTFGAPKYYATGATAQENRVYLGDVNGDGKLDIVIENMDGTISVLLNRGNGTFRPGVLITSIAALYPGDLDLQVADFNRDGKADIAAAAHVYSDYNEIKNLWVLLSTGNATFAPPAALPTSLPINTPVAADFNNDGKLDLVVSIYNCSIYNPYLTGYEFFEGNGDGTFTEVTSTATCNYDGQNYSATQAFAADFNGDGNQDVFITYPGVFGPAEDVLYLACYQAVGLLSGRVAILKSGRKSGRLPCRPSSWWRVRPWPSEATLGRSSRPTEPGFQCVRRSTARRSVANAWI